MEAQPIEILLVEDDLSDARRVRELLREAESWDYHLSHAQRLEDAVRHLESEPVDVVLLDLTLPNGSGLNTVTRAREVARAVPIVVLSSVTDEMFATMALRAGAQDYLAKESLTSESLVRSMRFAIARQGSAPGDGTALSPAAPEAQKRIAFTRIDHEIRSLLNVILGDSALIENRLKELGDDSQSPALEGLLHAGERLVDAIRTLLRGSRSEMRSFDIRPARLELPAFLQRHVQGLQLAAQKKGVALTCELDLPEAAIFFDDYCFSRALMNLLDASMKVTRTGTISTRLARDAQGSLCVEVQTPDADPGELAGLLFKDEPIEGRDLHGSHRRLALARQYLEANGAELLVHTEPGEGLAFTIRLSPACELRRVPVDALKRFRPSPAPFRSAPALPRKPPVLVVEDDRDTQRLMRALLGKSYEVLIAESGEEARRHLESRPDVRMILMDISLKDDEDGLVVTRALRRSDRWKDLPIIATTAHALPEDRRNALAAGCSAYLAKPLAVHELQAMMRSLLPAGAPQAVAARR